MITQFTDLNYTLGNEDVEFDRAMLRRGASHAVCVAGSGTRAIALLSRQPNRLTVVDTSTAQLHLTRLRLATVSALSHTEFLRFWGYPGHDATATERQSVFVGLDLDTETRASLHSHFSAVGWTNMLYSGRWERMLRRTTALPRLMMRRHGSELLSLRTTEQRVAFFARPLPRLALASHAALAAAGFFAYGLRTRKHVPRFNMDRSLLRYAWKMYYRMHTASAAGENPFVQLYLFGKLVSAQACPPEADASVFAAAKTATHDCDIRFEHGDVIESIARREERVDFLSLSNVPSFYRGTQEREFLQRISRQMTPGARIVRRDFLHEPRQADLGGYEDISAKAAEAATERTGLWRTRVLARLPHNQSASQSSCAYC